jgi:hypothetical protein
MRSIDARTRKPKPIDIPETILDQFAGPARPMSQGEVDTITKRFKKALVQRMLGGELTHHLGYPPGGEKPPEVTNHRNGTSPKTVLTDEGALTLVIPRDRDGTFEPQLIGKHERRFTGFDDKILALYARGMTVREIQAFLLEMYSVEVSPDFISTVTDAVHSEMTAWQSRPLEGRVAIHDVGQRPTSRPSQPQAISVFSDPPFLRVPDPFPPPPPSPPPPFPPPALPSPAIRSIIASSS